MNGYMSGADGNTQSIEAFVSQSEAFVRAHAIKYILPRVHGGVNTTAQIILDIEKPVDRAKFHDPSSNNCLPKNQPCYNDTLASAVAQALAMRVRVAHDVFPRATIGLYGTTVNTEPWKMDGYQRMARFGAYDGVDFSVPVLYLGRGMNATNHTSYVLSASSLLKKTTGEPIPMVPLMSWIWFGKGLNCEVTKVQVHEMLDVIATWDAKQLPVVSWWSGSDTSGHSACPGHPNISQYDWLTTMDLVPSRCLPN